jgi:hypothetical protein
MKNKSKIISKSTPIINQKRSIILWNAYKRFCEPKNESQSETLEKQSKEDSEDDGIFSEGDIWFPEEF